jgi:hypothetical protein
MIGLIQVIIRFNNCYLGTLDNHDNEKEEEYDEIAEDGQYYREKTEVAQALSVSSSTHRYSKWPQDQETLCLRIRSMLPFSRNL